MRHLFRFFWNATRGHRLAPWRSPYLRWRMETYSGLKMDKIGFLEFWGFLIRERKQLGRFLKWTAEMDNYARPKPKIPSTQPSALSIQPKIHSSHNCEKSPRKKEGVNLSEEFNLSQAEPEQLTKVFQWLNADC